MKILCPTDLTLATDIALSHAGNIAQRGNGEVTLFHVLTKEEVRNKDVGNPGPHVKTLDQLAKLKVKVNRVDREGTPLKEIVSEAKNGHSLMVAGTHGVHGLRQEWLGSDMLKLGVYLDANEKRQVEKYVVDTDEGPRASTLEGLAKLKPVFDAKGTVTAGNSSQTSDGAAFVLVVSERMLKQLNATPIAHLLSYHVAGVPPRIMGMGPAAAVPKAIEKAGLKLKDIELVELNEAFASQSVAVIRELGMNPDIVNVNGGAIALGHPLGCTGTKLSVQLFNEMRRRKQKYGVVTMCVGSGQGAASVFELLN